MTVDNEEITQGRYYLALLFPMGTKGPFDVKGGGVFTIDREDPSRNLGTITISRSKK